VHVSNCCRQSGIHFPHVLAFVERLFGLCPKDVILNLQPLLFGPESEEFQTLSFGPSKRLAAEIFLIRHWFECAGFRSIAQPVKELCHHQVRSRHKHHDTQFVCHYMVITISKKVPAFPIISKRSRSFSSLFPHAFDSRCMLTSSKTTTGLPP
jgi:hypothetical protein